MRHRILAGGFSLLLILSAISVAVPVTGSISNLAIESATPSVEDPAPGERFSVSVTIANHDATEAVEVTDVYIRDAGSANTHVRVDDVGTIRPGGTLSVPLSLMFDDAGTKDLRVHTRVENESGDSRSITYPLTIDVEPPDNAILTVDDVDAVAGQEEHVNVTVSNGDDRSLSNVRLELTGDAVVDNAERVTASLDAGTQVVHGYDVTFPEPGRQSITGTITYKTADGMTRSINRSVTLDVAPARVDPELTVTPIESERGPALEVSLTEYGNAELRDVGVRALQNGTVVARTLLEDVPAEETRTATLDDTDLGDGNISVVASYTAAGTERTIQTSRLYQPTESASVVLSGVEATRDGSIVTLRGDAANVGSSDVESVLVAIEPVAGVTPTSPNRDYFIGGIEASEFGTFELTANVTDTTETVPVRVTYSADGERFSQVAPVELDGAAAEAGSDEESTWDRIRLLEMAIVGLVVVLLGAALYRWRT
ncbi:COG1361 family protein [Halanaeroarchaeum sulfurireducens]|uniref:CARDB domain-containing protein n=2 Tax=Halanaeroarchaeum sulfurireducens TaxID=1604004 RepID=A0A0F7PA11_9EURY|nr:hypothetical protein [Halanaeroarchaeum sulfurireducens]AKH97622.1 hypothetical protein HLASF_1134 [Halanaeroarchaeum sulfurireducens]ALG82018.1 hypothetical protein HLASA_1123 [Halanaeroarchaeum sulfurireducens]